MNDQKIGAKKLETNYWYIVKTQLNHAYSLQYRREFEKLVNRSEKPHHICCLLKLKNH